jgi:hypothetical protein
VNCQPRAFNEPRGERALPPHAQTTAIGRSPAREICVDGRDVD